MRVKRVLRSEGDCIEVYLATCDRDQVAPQRAVIRGLQKHEVDVRHRCLGDQDAHALSVALCVRKHAGHIVAPVLLFCQRINVGQSDKVAGFVTLL